MRGLGVIACGAACAAMAGPAVAGPWAQDTGSWYARALVTQEELNGAEATRLELYGEYGFAKDWTFTGKSEAVAFHDMPEFDKETWRFTVRRELASSGGWTLGVEAGAVNGSTVAGIFSCRDWGIEGRLSGGYSALYKGREYFFFADAATIQHEDGCRLEPRNAAYCLLQSIIFNKLLSQKSDELLKNYVLVPNN